MMEGRHIITVEGLSEEEKEIYDRASEKQAQCSADSVFPHGDQRQGAY